jgi:hypothetical protein
MLANADLANATRSPEPMPKKRGGISGRAFLPADYPELRLFALLMWKFGRPNGPMSLLWSPADGDPDAPFKWDFLFVPAGELKLHVMRSGGGIELMWWGETAEESDILAYLEKNIHQHEKEIELAIASLEQYTLILNPYVRHRNTSDFALKELDQIVIGDEPQVPIGHQEGEAVQEYIDQHTAYVASAQQQASLMLLLVTESAFMAESYLNLILAILVRKEIRASQTIFEETLRRQWKAKIERLHIECVGISRAADVGDSRMRDAKRLFDTRNRVAHSYPDKKDMAVAKMWFFKSFPVLEKAEPFSRFVVALGNQLPSLEDAKFCKKAASGLVEYLTEMIDEPYLSDFRYVSTRNPLGYNETKGVYGVPFGNTVVLSVTHGTVPKEVSE